MFWLAWQLVGVYILLRVIFLVLDIIEYMKEKYKDRFDKME